MKHILLQLQTDSNSISDYVVYADYSSWFWIAIVEFFIIIILLIRWNKKKIGNKNVLKDEIKSTLNNEVNMDDLMNSINNSRQLYKELCRVYHPDRFTKSSEKEIAESIFQDISANKRNYNELIKIKLKAERKLLTN